MTRRVAQADSEAPNHWPAGVRPISLKGLDYLGVSDELELYWDGKPIEVRKRVNLSVAQKFGAVIVTSSAIVGAVSAAL